MQQVLAEKAHSTSDHAYGAIPAPSELAARLASAGRAALSKATGEPAPATGSAGSSGATADAAYPVLHVPRFPEGKLRAGDEIEGLSQQQWFTLLSTPHADGPSIVGPFAIRVAGVVVKHEAFLIWTDGGKITGWMPASEIPPGGTRRGNWLLWSDGHLLQVIRDRPEDAKQMRAHAPQMSEHDLKNRQEADVELNRDLEHYVASGSSIEHAQHQVYKAHRDVLVQLVQDSFRIFGVFAGAMAAEEAIEAAGDAIGRLGKKTPSAESAEEGSTNGTRARSTEPNERALAGEETGTKRGSRVDESKAPRDMFEEGADAKEGHLDVFSRYVVGWMIADGESAALAKRLIDETCHRQQIAPGQLTLHADRGSSMISKPVAFLLADLGVTKTHSRPHVSDDNPYSEAHFKTLKYRPDFPERFGCIEDARAHCDDFLRWYNTEHHHSGLGMLTPHDVHDGLAAARREQRAIVLAAAHQAHPERFPNGSPSPAPLPTAVWINVAVRRTAS